MWLPLESRNKMSTSENIPICPILIINVSNSRSNCVSNSRSNCFLKLFFCINFYIFNISVYLLKVLWPIFVYIKLSLNAITVYEFFCFPFFCLTLCFWDSPMLFQIAIVSSFSLLNSTQLSTWLRLESPESCVSKLSIGEFSERLG